MRIHSPKTKPISSRELISLLHLYRKQRNFNAQDYLDQKAKILNQYLSKYNLKSCVIGVSGGIDSAVTLGIVSYASKISGSPIQKIIPALLPIFSDSATNQDEALSRGREVSLAFGLKPIVIDLSISHQTVKDTTDQALGICGQG